MFYIFSLHSISHVSIPIYSEEFELTVRLLVWCGMHSEKLWMPTTTTYGWYAARNCKQFPPSVNCQMSIAISLSLSLFLSLFFCSVHFDLVSFEGNSTNRMVINMKTEKVCLSALKVINHNFFVAKITILAKRKIL